jgi:hypothetical protein
VHTVIETPTYLRATELEGLSHAERNNIVTIVAADPTVGDIVQGTGGCRKVRIPGRGKGKSGGYRLITFYGGIDMPVFLLTIYGKGHKADMSKAERNELAKRTTALVESLTMKVRK